MKHEHERRSHHRFAINQAIEIEFPKETIFDAEGIDLSEKGLRIKTARDMDPCSKIFILINGGPSEADKIYFDSVTAWKEKKGKDFIYGLKISDIDHGSSINLKKFLKAHPDILASDPVSAHKH